MHSDDYKRMYRLIFSWDPCYNTLRLVYNKHVNVFPAVIVMCAHVEHVIVLDGPESIVFQYPFELADITLKALWIKLKLIYLNT